MLDLREIRRDDVVDDDFLDMLTLGDIADGEIFDGSGRVLALDLDIVDTGSGNFEALLTVDVHAGFAVDSDGIDFETGDALDDKSSPLIGSNLSRSRIVGKFNRCDFARSLTGKDHRGKLDGLNALVTLDVDIGGIGVVIDGADLIESGTEFGIQGSGSGDEDSRSRSHDRHIKTGIGVGLGIIGDMTLGVSIENDSGSGLCAVLVVLEIGDAVISLITDVKRLVFDLETALGILGIDRILKIIGSEGIGEGELAKLIGLTGLIEEGRGRDATDLNVGNRGDEAIDGIKDLIVADKFGSGGHSGHGIILVVLALEEKTFDLGGGILHLIDGLGGNLDIIVAGSVIGFDGSLGFDVSLEAVEIGSAAVGIDVGLELGFIGGFDSTA